MPEPHKRPYRHPIRLPLRQAQGFVRSILTLMDIDLPCPDHTTLSRCNATVKIRGLKDREVQEPVALIVDSTGLQVCGQGAWHRQKHGEKKRKRWKKRHIGVDDQGQIIASCVTESDEQDPFEPDPIFQPDGGDRKCT